MTISLVEANMTGLQHSVINRIVVRMLLMDSDIEHINLCCSQAHYEALNIKDPRISYTPLKVLKPGKFRIIKFILESWQTFNIIRKCNDDLVYFLSCFPNVHYFLTKFHRLVPDKKIMITVHGEAEGLVMPGKWKIWSYPFWITRTFKLEVPDNIYRLVLGKSIYENLRELGYAKNVFHIEHPYEDFRDSNDILPAKGKNIFAYVGNCLEKKGGAVFVEAARQVQDAQFWVVGAYDLQLKYPQNLNVLSKGKMLSYSEFNSSLEKITYACYPYSSDSYRFTASGAVFDAIKYLKPIIYIKNDYFDGIFQGLDVGYRCNDKAEFIAVIQKLNAHDYADEYKRYVANLKHIQKKFEVNTVAGNLFSIINKIHYA